VISTGAYPDPVLAGVYPDPVLAGVYPDPVLAGVYPDPVLAGVYPDPVLAGVYPGLVPVLGFPVLSFLAPRFLRTTDKSIVRLNGKCDLSDYLRNLWSAIIPTQGAGFTKNQETNK